jgi:lipopolysaccharide transport system permease protein
MSVFEKNDSNVFDASAVESQSGNRLDFRTAALDFFSGFALWPLWLALGWNDILQRYRRSFLGPFWLTASMGVMILVLGVLYANLFHTNIHDFLPFLCAGLLAWNLISSFLTEGGTLFTSAEAYIKQIKLPYSVYVYRSTWSKFLIFLHNSIVYVGVLLYFQIWPGVVFLMTIPALLLILVNGALSGLCIGMISARFRDVPPIINSVIQIVFFMTPIFWKPELLEGRASIVDLNPFYHLVEIIRAPMLGHMPSLENYLVVFLLTAINLAITSLIFARFRSRIAFWV